MMKKLYLFEDFENEVATLKDEIKTSEEENNFAVSNLISNLIKAEWDVVDLYNAMLITLQDKNAKDVEEIIENNISNHYIHIGQLEKALQSYNSFASEIEDGQELIDIS